MFRVDGVQKEWTSLGVLKETRKKIKEIAKRENLRMYEVVELLVNKYAVEQKYERRGKQYHAGYTVDRELWYAFKLVNSVAQLKFVVEEVKDESKIEEYKSMTEKTIEQIEERLGLDLSRLKKLIDKFIEKPTGKNKFVLNDEVKKAMAEIIFSFIS